MHAQHVHRAVTVDVHRSVVILFPSYIVALLALESNNQAIHVMCAHSEQTNKPCASSNNGRLVAEQEGMADDGPTCVHFCAPTAGSQQASRTTLITASFFESFQVHNP